MSAEALADERERVLAARLADRVGQVDDEDRRQAIDRQDEPEAGEREDERGQQQRPDDERDASPADAGPPPRARHSRANVRPRAGTSRSSASGASKAMPTSGTPSRGPPDPARQAAPGPGDDVAVIERPLDAQADQDDQDDREPQLVAGRRPRRRGGGIRRSRGAGRGDAPGTAAARPSFSRAAADPGVIVDSATSNRSTANRIGAFGSTRPAPAPALPDGRGVADGTRRRRRRRPRTRRRRSVGAGRIAVAT